MIVTLGAGGALIKTASTADHIAAIRAGSVLETTGAGDAFNAGLAVALAESLEVANAVRFGCAAAGISVTRYGTTPAMPTRQQVEAILHAT